MGGIYALWVGAPWRGLTLVCPGFIKTPMTADNHFPHAVLIGFAPEQRA